MTSALVSAPSASPTVSVRPVRPSISRDGVVSVAGTVVGSVAREPGNRWGSADRRGRVVTRNRWTRSEAVDALVGRWIEATRGRAALRVLDALARIPATVAA